MHLFGKKVTVEIPSKQWTLVIGIKRDKYTVGVNGVEMSALPEAPKTAASQPEHCRSTAIDKYSETIK